MSRTVGSVHNDWLTLIEPVGAFLTLPVIKRAFPNGIPQVDRDLRADVRLRIESLTDDRSVRTSFLQWVLRELLGLEGRLRESAGVPPTLTCSIPVHATVLRPDFAVMEPADEGPERARMLVFRWPLRTPLHQRPARDEHGVTSRWPATPIERASAACREVNVPLALVTDTDRFAIVWAPRNAPGGHAVWPSSLFGEERLLLDAFVALLGMQRFFGVAENETLESLLSESASAQAEVTNQLGHQVREAVELLVAAMSRAHRSSGLSLLRGIAPQRVYSAAVTVMMRLVVMLAAEERRLLPADDPLYAESYSVTALREQLERIANRDGLETLEKRHTGWHRLLATFRAVHGGIQHDRLRLPAYGGSLFDPDRYGFLERPSPLPVDDHTTLEILNALQVLVFRQGGVTEARRLSYVHLDVEQIGHVYEGLLDHGCRRVDDDIVLGLTGKRGDEPELSLSALETQLAKGDEVFAQWLKGQGGPQPARTQRLLYEQLEPDASHRLMAACDNDETVYKRLLPFAGLLREDLRRLPVVILPGALYVTKTSERRDSGTAYTTKELADEVVRYALEPLVYSPGPAEGAAPADWKLKSSADILNLKVCDPAVGSGAILVAACRYLAATLVTAWSDEAKTGAASARTPAGGFLDESEWSLAALRCVTDHCLYGVDRNPMAVEMAKLSLWLTTMARERPFTFLDHQVRCGDSLVGIGSLEQVRWFHIDPDRGKELHAKHSLYDPTRAIDPRVERALAKTRALAGVDANTIRDVETQQRLHLEMLEALRPLAVVADAVAGAALATPARGYRPPWVLEDDETPTTDDLLNEVADDVALALTSEDTAARDLALASLRDKAEFWLETDRPDGAPDRICLHWPLAFPEVFLSQGRCGFDAFVGNPPFLGGQRIRGAMGTAFRTYLVEHVAAGKRGSADLVAYFYLRAFNLLNDPGIFGFLATNTIAQGDTREVGLDELLERGATIVRAVPSEPWPGTAALEIAKVWIRKGKWKGERFLSDTPVHGVSAALVIPGRVTGKPFRLKANENKSFIGSYVLGMGFVMTSEEADALIAKDERNREVLFPYLNGEDLNSRWDQSPSRWVINFRDWPLERTADGHWEYAEAGQRREWLRSGRVPRDYPGRVAADFPECLEIVRLKVKPEREANRYSASARRYWWRYERWRGELYSTIAPLKRVIVTAQTSRRWAPALQNTGIVYSHTVVVFPFSTFDVYAVLQGVLHEEWRLQYGASLKQDARYTPSDCFDTFPFPAEIGSLESVGQRYSEHRSSIARSRREGLTKTAHRMHSPGECATDITHLRDLQIELDQLLIRAYGWDDVALAHGFHNTTQGLRFTISRSARDELLQRLLELNHHRYAQEAATDAHEAAQSMSAEGLAVAQRRGVPRRNRKPRDTGAGLFPE